MTRPSRLRIAVIGQGHFAQAAVLPAIEQLDDVELTALVSGSPHKLSELGERYGVRSLSHYDDLDDLLARGRVDAVYIAVPNDLHAEMTLIAARHGVHVLCEKPMAPTEAECMQMIRACESRGVRLMIAYRLHFEAANLIAVEVARGGEIGEPRIFSSTFAMQVRDGNTRVQARRGAGPLYDLGVYCVNAARYLFRAEPTEVMALKASGRDPRFASVDEAYAVTLRFPTERVAQFTCSFGASRAFRCRSRASSMGVASAARSSSRSRRTSCSRPTTRASRVRRSSSGFFRRCSPSSGDRKSVV